MYTITKNHPQPDKKKNFKNCSVQISISCQGNTQRENGYLSQGLLVLDLGVLECAYDIFGSLGDSRLYPEVVPQFLYP